MTVNHSLHFKDPVIGAYSNIIESAWILKIFQTINVKLLQKKSIFMLVSSKIVQVKVNVLHLLTI